jgi:hypothetical protein
VPANSMPLRRRPRARRARAWEALRPRREDRVPRGVASMRRRGPASARKGGAAPLARAPPPPLHHPRPDFLLQQIERRGSERLRELRELREMGPRHRPELLCLRPCAPAPTAAGLPAAERL